MKKIALVTGGAVGIGEAISRQLASDGFKVIVSYNSSGQKAEALCKEICSMGGEVYSYKCDVSSLSHVEEMLSVIKKEHGNVYCLVNNAGISLDGYLMVQPVSDIERVLSVNLMGTINCSKAVFSHMIRKKEGRIVNISSVSGIVGLSGQTAYSASKAGIIGFTRSLAKEVAGYGILVNSISPGYVNTDMLKGLSEKLIGDYKSSIPLKRFAEPDEIADAVGWLCSDKCKYITGQNIVIDGGLST